MAGPDVSMITVSSLAAMITDLASKASTLQSQAALQRRAGEFGIGGQEFQNIIGVGQWIDGELPMLRRRLSLAKALEQQAGPGAMVSLDEPVQMPTEADLKRMRDLAKGLKEHNRSDAKGAELYHQAALKLAGLNDPDLLSAFFGELGPQHTQLLTSVMTASGSKTERKDLEAFSKALGTASKDADPPQSFTNIMAQFKKPPMHGDRFDSATAWQRLALLQYGDFDSQWLTEVVQANGLNQFKGKDRDRIDFRGGSTFDVQGTGLPEDTLALAFGALKNNPVAARNAINSMGPMKDTVTLVYDYAKGHGSGDEVADNFGLAIEAGTGSTTEKPGQHSAEASKFAYEFVIAAGKQKEVPWPIKDSLGNVAASYSHEMLTGGQTEDALCRMSGLGKPQDFDGLPGVNPSFYLSTADTYKFLHGFADNDQLADKFDSAMGDLYTVVTTEAAKQDKAAIAAGKNDPEHWEDAHGAFGGLAGLQYQSQMDVRGAMDASDKKLRENIRLAITLGVGEIPSPQGLAAKYAWKGVTNVTNQTLLKSYVNGGQTRAGQVEANDDQMTLTAMYTVATQLVNADYPHTDIPADIRGPNGKLLSVAEIAQDQDRINSFNKWTDSNNQDHYNFDSKITDGVRALLGSHKFGADNAKQVTW